MCICIYTIFGNVYILHVVNSVLCVYIFSCIVYTVYYSIVYILCALEFGPLLYFGSVTRFDFVLIQKPVQHCKIHDLGFYNALVKNCNVVMGQADVQQLKASLLRHSEFTAKQFNSKLVFPASPNLKQGASKRLQMSLMDHREHSAY